MDRRTQNRQHPGLRPKPKLSERPAGAQTKEYLRIAAALKLEEPLKRQQEQWWDMLSMSLDGTMPGTVIENLTLMLARAEEAALHDDPQRNAWRFQRLADAAPTIDYLTEVGSVAASCGAFTDSLQSAITAATNRLTGQ